MDVEAAIGKAVEDSGWDKEAKGDGDEEVEC